MHYQPCSTDAVSDEHQFIVSVKNGKEEMAMKRSNEKGTAMLFAIILVLVLSVMAASMMFLSQSETWSRMNYRLMPHPRYGAEARIHPTATFLLNHSPPPPP